MLNTDAAKRVDLLALIEPVTKLNRVTPNEWAGPCPRCGGTDRFRVNVDKGWFCRKCEGEPGSGGHWKDAIDFVMWRDGVPFKTAVLKLAGNATITEEDLQRMIAERKERERLDKIEKAERLAAARQELNFNNDWKTYNRNLKDIPGARDLWRKRGLIDDWQDYYGLGYCQSREWVYKGIRFTSDSLTIPYHQPVCKNFPGEGMEYKWTEIDLKHRLLKPAGPGDKYRHHISHLGNNLFITDLHKRTDCLFGDLLIVEGEIKAMVTWAALWYGDDCMLPNVNVVSVPGKNWSPEWIESFKKADRVFVSLDPDANKESDILVSEIGGNARAVKLPAKIDDLILLGALDHVKIHKVLESAWSNNG